MQITKRRLETRKRNLHINEMELFILMAPALSELWSSLIDCSHSCGKFLVMNESRKNLVNERIYFYETGFRRSSPKYQSVRFSNKNEIDFCEREISIPVNKLPSSLVQSKAVRFVSVRKVQNWIEMGQTGRWEIKRRFFPYAEERSSSKIYVHVATSLALCTSNPFTPQSTT